MDSYCLRSSYSGNLPDYLCDSLLSVIDPMDKSSSIFEGQMFPYLGSDPMDLTQDSLYYPYTGMYFQDDLSFRGDNLCDSFENIRLTPCPGASSSSSTTPENNFSWLSSSTTLQYESAVDANESHTFNNLSSILELNDRAFSFRSPIVKRRSSNIPKELDPGRFVQSIDLPLKPSSAGDQHPSDFLFVPPPEPLQEVVPIGKTAETVFEFSAPRGRKRTRVASYLEPDSDAGENGDEWKSIAAQISPKRTRQSPPKKRISATRKRCKCPPKARIICGVDNCGKAFTREADRQRHVFTKHASQSDEEVLARVCDACKFLLSRRDARQRHERACKGKPKEKSSSPNAMATQTDL